MASRKVSVEKTPEIINPVPPIEVKVTPPFLITHKLYPGIAAGVLLVVILSIVSVRMKNGPIGIAPTPFLRPSLSPTRIVSTPIRPTISYLSPTPVVPRRQTLVTLGDLTWLSKPVEIDPPDIYISDPSYSTKAYHIANIAGGGRLLNMTVHIYGMMDYDDLARVIETSAKKYIVVKPLENWDSFDAFFLSSVDYTTQSIPGLETPSTITVGNNVYSRENYATPGITFSSLSDPKRITTTTYGDLYQVRNKLLSLKDLYSRQIYLLLKDGTAVRYELDTNLFSDDKSPFVKWSDGRSESSHYEELRTGGCGFGVSGTAIIVDNSPLLGGLKPVGKTFLGDTVYQLTDPNNDFVKFLYKDSYSGTRGNPVGIKEFASQPNHFLWKDKLGDWQFYINQEFATMAECAKPVIYLYPPSKQPVSVQVGAIIRQSDPVYPASGWQVVADPSGKIFYQDKTYPYLFWDGLGLGIYPDLSGVGTVVQKSQVEDTLRQHLSQQGLNNQESQDFLDFWLPLMPDTPYVRLTWLTLSQMNTLAPLKVSPTPDTTIRVFLDYEGLDNFVNLIPQKFAQPIRKGFTLVEWGGLKK
jgi:hypothetical protein